MTKNSRKLKKLVRSPKLFFKDMASNLVVEKMEEGCSDVNEEFARIRGELGSLRKENTKLKQELTSTQKAISQVSSFCKDGLSPQWASSLYTQDLLEMSKSWVGWQDASNFVSFLGRYREFSESLSDSLYSHLDEEDKAMFRRWMIKRYGRIDTLREGELAEYESLLQFVKKIPELETISHQGRKYKVKNLKSIGYDISFVTTSDYVLVNDFKLQQYRHKEVFVREGDVIIDAGAYTGDTAVIFACDTNYNSEIHSFELSEANLSAFEANLALNPKLRSQIKMNRLALTEKSGETVYFDEGSHEDAVFSAFKIGSTNEKGVGVPTITIDDYVTSEGLSKVDFIKMDIEGAEREALAGARNTIKEFKPRLAISLYHLWDDPFVIAELIRGMHDGYKFYFNWYNKRLANEAVLYAIDKDDTYEM